MATRLQRSFNAVNLLLERPHAARRVVAGLLFVHTLLLAYSAHVHSPTLNEPGHLVAGLSHWKFGRFDLYRVNPPLVRMVAALPVMAAGYNEDWSGFYEGPGARPEMGMGENFVAANGERSFLLFMIARWACIPFSWIGAIVCYLWARDLYGRPAGVMACGIWCFEPNILAHASLITADAGATALGLAACYTFWRWLKQPTWLQAALTGVVLGFAELAKTTLIVFYPLWPLMWLIYRWSERKNMFARDWLREAAMLALRMAIGLYVVNMGYGFEGTFTPLNNFTFISDLFTGNKYYPHSGVQSAQSVNRFADTILGNFAVPLPKNYLLGIDIQQKDFEHYAHQSYLCGVWQDRGWWYYYLYACAIKVPLGLWALGLIAMFDRFFLRRLQIAERRPANTTPRSESRHARAAWRDEFILVCPAIIIFTVVSSKTGFNEHMRYVLPSFPYCFVAVSNVLTAGYLTPSKPGVYCGRSGADWRLARVPLFSTALVNILKCWIFTSSLWIYPHSLAYFNESIGGPRNGAKHLLGSNLDWGQDLLYVRDEYPCRNQPMPHLAYYGSFNPTDTGMDKYDPVVFTIGTDRDLKGEIHKHGLFAISANLIFSKGTQARDGQNADVSPLPVDVRQCFLAAAPVGYAGYSIMVYRLFTASIHE